MTDPTVTRLWLGTMSWGGKVPAAEGHRPLDAFRAAGGTFVDTADVHEDGGSERALAPWLRFLAEQNGVGDVRASRRPATVRG